MNTTAKITRIIQDLISHPPFKKGVEGLKSEYLIEDLEGNDLLDSYIQFGDALETWVTDQIPEDACSLYLCFLHSLLEYVRWDLIAQHLHAGMWRHEDYPEDDEPYQGYANTLTHEASMQLDSTSTELHQKALVHVRRRLKGVFTQQQLGGALRMLYHDYLFQEDRRRGLSKFPYRSVTNLGIECIAWHEIAKTLETELMASLELSVKSDTEN
jgi:hypothetical protein